MVSINMNLLLVAIYVAHTNDEFTQHQKYNFCYCCGLKYGKWLNARESWTIFVFFYGVVLL